MSFCLSTGAGKCFSYTLLILGCWSEASDCICCVFLFLIFRIKKNVLHK